MSLLSVENLSKRFGGVVAVDDVSFSVEAGEILSIIGPNGAGKSTLFKMICSFVRPSAGRVRYRGRTISGLKPHRVARLGVVRTFQETTVFREMTALENVVIAHHHRARAGFVATVLATRTARGDDREFRGRAGEILDYLGLGALKDERARNLPHGHLRALGVAMAMAAEPKVILLDEPVAGMNPDETDRAVAMIRGIRDKGVTVLLVEHDMLAVMRISDRIVVLNFGSKIAEGTPAAIRDNPAVVEAYLGRDDDFLGTGVP